jgi:hypoxanthine phosphoribosyltransferase
VLLVDAILDSGEEMIVVVMVSMKFRPAVLVALA